MGKGALALGYTLIELLIVLGVIGFVAALTFFGIASFNRGQVVVNAQREFLGNLRAVSNKVLNGADGASVKTVVVPDGGGSYTLDGTVISLPRGVTVATGLGETVTVCFNNPNLTLLVANQCGSCAGGSLFACHGIIAVSSGALTFTFTNGSNTKRVVVEGSGLLINRMYAQ